MTHDFVMKLVLLCLFASPASPETLVTAFPRVVPDKEAVALVDIDGEPVGAIELIEKDGNYGFLLVMTKAKHSEPPEHAKMELDKGSVIRFQCLTMVFTGLQMITCVSKSPIFLERLSTAEEVELSLGDPDSRKEEKLLRVVFSGPGLARLIASVSSH